MAQVKIYGCKEQLTPIKRQLSDVIHWCTMQALGLPPEKRHHRFFPLEQDDFIYPADRSAAYTVIEVNMMTGCTVATRKRLVCLLFERIQAELGIAVQDLEINIIESPPCNWGFRGLHGDEAKLSYKVRQIEEGMIHYG